MKNQLIIRNLLLLIISFSLGSFCFAQTAKKSTVRLSVQYFKIMDGEVFFEIRATSRVNKKNIQLANIDLSIYNELDDDTVLLDKLTTDHNGTSKITLDNIDAIQPDSTQVYTIKVTFKGNDSFKKASRSISFKNADINAKLITKDSINYIEATLLDSNTGSPIENEYLGVQVERLFLPLIIEELNKTDENGTILVPIENGIPGVDGIINIEVVLNDSDDYGTVKSIVSAPIGKPIVDESKFDERTMWSSRDKTPIFLLIFPNLLIFGMWGLIIYLFINLFKIYKLNH